MSTHAAQLHEYLRLSYRRRKVKDWLMRGALAGAALLAILPLFSVLWHRLPAVPADRDLQGSEILNLHFAFRVIFDIRA